MSIARLRVTHAGPLVTLQDKGRFGHLRYGVAASGPMDRVGYAAGFAALGAAKTGTAIEVSLGGVALECAEGAVTLSIAGGGFSASLGAQTLKGWGVVSLRAGDRLTIRGGTWGSWCYIAPAGEIDADHWLGQSATHSMTGFGGGALRAGQVLTITDAKLLPAREGPTPCPEFAKPTDRIRAVIGPQDRFFEAGALQAFASKTFTVSDAYDRMGMRLKGPPLTLSGALSIPSEPILRGAVQVSGDGVPTVLLADHGTTGGYPKIATVLAEDQDRLAQLRAGDSFRFQTVTPQQAVAIARQEAAARDSWLDALRQPRATLSEKLMRENLVGGVVSGDES